MRSPRPIAYRGRDGSAERVPYQRRRRRAALFDQLVEPGEHPVGVQSAVSYFRRTVARQVRGNHPMGRHQGRDDPDPGGRELTPAVQHHQRWAVTPVQHGRRHAGQLQPSFGGRDGRQQPRASLIAGGRRVGALLRAGAPAHPSDCSCADAAAGVSPVM
jgi:hypothetical protein